MRVPSPRTLAPTLTLDPSHTLTQEAGAPHSASSSGRVTAAALAPTRRVSRACTRSHRQYQ